MTEYPTYTRTAIILHWLIALIWIGVWCMGILAVYGRATFNPNYVLTFWHKAIASSLLFLVVIRIIWRITHTPPPLPSTINPFMQRAAKFGHFVIYAVALIAMPMSGWFYSSVAGHPVMALGFFELPALTSKNQELIELARTTHFTLAFISAALIAGHTLFALKHHFINRNSVLNSMLPHTKKNQ